MRHLRTHRWYARLPPALQTALTDEADVRHVGAGEWIYGTGDSPRGVFAVLEGAALVYIALPRGDDVLVHVAVPGEIFGHAARLGRGPRLATVIAAGETELLYLSEQALERVGRRAPDLWPSLIRLLYEQLGELLVQLAQTLVLPARARLAVQLLRLSGGGGSRTRPVVLPQSQLAELVGVTRKTVNLLLQELVQTGCIDSGHRRIHVTDRRALAMIARGDPATHDAG